LADVIEPADCRADTRREVDKQLNCALYDLNPIGDGCGTCRIDFNKRVHVHELENQVVSRPYGVRGSIELTAKPHNDLCHETKTIKKFELGNCGAIPRPGSWTILL
jgi:hypothetical protein